MEKIWYTKNWDEKFIIIYNLSYQLLEILLNVW